MIRLYIDGVETTPLKTSSIMPQYDLSKLRNIDAWRTGEDIEVEVESSPDIEAIMGYAADLHRATSFNNDIHHTTLTLDGVTIFEGNAILIATHSDATKCRYVLRLRSGGAKWAKEAALTTLNKSDIPCQMPLTISGIERTWRNDNAVRFLPLQRDSYPEPKDAGLFTVEQILMPHDYHPFISMKALLDSIINKEGYRLQSDFANSDLFKRLMMSGAYHSTDSTLAENTMGFKAYRSYSSTKSAPQSGILNLCMPMDVTHNIGAIVDSADPTATDESGKRLINAYNNGESFKFVDDTPVFTPTREISLSFECFLHYTTECRIVSSSRLQGFSNIHLANGCDIDVILQNPYIDRRSEILPSTRYKLMVFDHQEGAVYKLEGLGEGLSDECTITSPANATGYTRLYYKSTTDGEYQPFNGDWAIYDGHVDRTLTREVMLTARTPYEVVTPTSPKRFNNIYMSGAMKGQQLTIHSGCYIRPIFSGAAGYGEVITFEDISHHNITQAQILEALAHMFNLCIYSHEPSKSVVIEPYDNFFNGNTVDWRTRQIDGEWRYEEGAPDCFERIRVCYAGNDGVVRRTMGEDSSYGEWVFTTTGYSSKMGTETRANHIFYPSVAFTESTTSAPSAEILTVGDRNSTTGNDYIEPRIVLYHGMKMLPTGEHWQAYTTHESYPFASFHSPSAEMTLDFSDRDNLVGLHQYYDRELLECSERGTFVCSIKLRPDEYLSLLDPNSEGANIRSRFRLRNEYGSSLFTLMSIEEYDPDNYVATCRFRRTLTD